MIKVELGQLLRAKTTRNLYLVIGPRDSTDIYIWAVCLNENECDDLYFMCHVGNPWLRNDVWEVVGSA